MQEFKNGLSGEETRLFSQEETVESLERRMNQLQQEMAEDGFIETKRIKIGRNDICPCGSKKKFKKCCIHKVNKR